MADHQPNVFDTVTKQGDLFAGIVTENSGIAHPDPVIIRQRMLAILEALKAAQQGSPWNPRDTKMNLIIFPQMSDALPRAEAEELKLAFKFELTRLGLAA